MLKPLLLLLIMILQTALVHFHSILSIAAVHFAFVPELQGKDWLNLDFNYFFLALK